MPDESTAKRREINLDAARAARAAAKGEPASLTLEGNTYELPIELPVAFVEAVVEERLQEAMGILLGPEVAAELEASTSMSVEDWEELANGIAEVYGIQGGLGNLPASTSSSSSISSR